MVWLLELCRLPCSRSSADSGTRRFAEGYFDCAGGDEALQHGVRRAYRRLALESHPDKGGSAAVAADLTELRDSWLRDPLRFQVFRAMFEAPSLQPFGSELPRGDEQALRSAAARVLLRDGWPYLEVEIALDHGGRLADGGTWSFAFGLKGVSTVHYRGDEAVGGYDVCCDFLAGSRCQRRPSPPVDGADLDGAARCSGEEAEDDGVCSPYLVSDCPLPSNATFVVRRPLHLNSTGQWGAALRVRDADGDEAACVALAFRHSGPEGLAAEAVLPAPREAPEVGDDGAPPKGAPPPEPAPQSRQGTGAVSFRHVRTGGFCADGADLLEGAVDDYGGLSPLGGARRADAETSMFYGSRCREKCRSRRLCRFYTAYSSGWCQLSSRCSRLAGAGDPLTVTFEKVAE